MQSVGLDRNVMSGSTTHLSRKPLLKHSPQPQNNPAFCACGRVLQAHKQSAGLHKQSAARRHPLTVSAAAAVEAPAKSSARKRKQHVEPLLVVEEISKTHDGQRYLFEGVSFTVNRGDRLVRHAAKSNCLRNTDKGCECSGIATSSSFV